MQLLTDEWRRCRDEAACDEREMAAGWWRRCVRVCVCVCGGMIVPAENTQRVLFPPSDRRLRLQPKAGCAVEMTAQISKALPKQPGVQETTKALIIILWLAILKIYHRMFKRFFSC